MIRAKLGDVELNIVSSERLNHAAETSDKPVESGQDIVDHTKTKAPIIELVGAVMGDGASQKLEQLKKYQREGKLVKYIHRNEYHEMFILDIGTRHEVHIRDGYEFNITLKQIKIAKAKSIELNVVNPVTKTASPKTQASVKPVTNKGRQQPQTKPVTKTSDVLAPGRQFADTPSQALLNSRGLGGLPSTTKAIVDLYNLNPKPPAMQIGGISHEIS